jgi:aminoglycoside N3'-acetyltransferase
MRDVSIYVVAMNLGTSVHYIEKTYAKQLTAIKRQAQLTKGQSYWKEIEESQLGDLEMLSKSESRKNKDNLDIAKIAGNLIDDGLIE